MKSHFSAELCLALCGVAALSFSPMARGQGGIISPVPDAARPGDLSEVDELDRSETPESLSAEAEAVSGTKLEADIQSVSQGERRVHYDYAVGLILGKTMPWATYGFEAGALMRQDVTFGMYAGGGSYSTNGSSDNEKSYDLKMHTQGAGVTSRYYVSRIEGLSLRGAIGYMTWYGNIAPHGSDDQLLDPAEKLSASFRSTGLAGGVSAAVTWVFSNGVFLEWTPVGLEKAKILSEDGFLGSPLARTTLHQNIEATRINGLVDVVVGYYF